MIFKHEDFKEVLSVKADFGWHLEYVTKTANLVYLKKLKECTVVYCDKDELHFSGVDEIGYTHKGYLIGVEEIKKECVKHEPELLHDSHDSIGTVICKHCGVEIVADWKAK